MTRSELLKTVIMGATFFLLPYLMSRFTVKQLETPTPTAQLGLFLISNVFLLTLDSDLWKTTYGWVAGFANFCVSALFLGIWIAEIIAACDEQPNFKSDSVIKKIGLFLASVIGQLFLENIAIYCVALVIVLCVSYYIRFKKIPGRIIWMLMGALLGLVIMFSNSLYGSLLSTGTAIDSYREIPILGNAESRTIINRLANAILLLGGRLFSLNVVLTITILIVQLVVLLQRRNDKKIKYIKIYIAFNTLLISVFACCYGIEKLYGENLALQYVKFFAAVCFFVLTFLEVRKLFQGKVRRRLLSYWLSAIGVIAPLVVTSETGHRLFFTSNFFLAIFAVELLAYVISTALFRVDKVMVGIASVVSVGCLLFYGIIYTQIGICKREHDALIEKAISGKQEQIVLPTYPYEEYLHAIYPIGEQRIQWYKEFYGIDENVVVTFEDQR